MRRGHLPGRLRLRPRAAERAAGVPAPLVHADGVRHRPRPWQAGLPVPRRRSRRPSIRTSRSREELRNAAGAIPRRAASARSGAGIVQDQGRIAGAAREARLAAAVAAQAGQPALYLDRDAVQGSGRLPEGTPRKAGAAPGRAVGVVARQAIHGLGGVGKTRLAIEYAWQNRPTTRRCCSSGRHPGQPAARPWPSWSARWCST